MAQFRLEALVEAAPGEAPLELHEVEFGEVGAQLQAQVGQAHVGGGRDQLPAGEAQPQAQRAAAGGQADRVVDPAAPAGEVGVVELGVGLALPEIDAVEVLAAKVAADVDARGQRARRFRGDAEAVAAAAVVELEVEALEFESRRRAQLVDPGDLRIADHHAVLRQQPVGEVVLAGLLRRHLEAGGVEASLAVAAQHQAGRVELEPGQAQLEVPQRAPGKFRLDLVEAERGAALGVADFEAFEVERRAQAGPVRLDAADAHRAVDRAADGALEVAAVVLDLRQDRVAQREHQQREGEVGRRRQQGQRAQRGSDPGTVRRREPQSGKQS